MQKPRMITTNLALGIHLVSIILSMIVRLSSSFVSPHGLQRKHVDNSITVQKFSQAHKTKSASSALYAFSFGGTQSSEMSTATADSNELVPVRIERTSANSRRIAGEIIVPTRLMDVWAIITDYNRLSQHIPNLVESKIVSSNNKRVGGSEQGNGSFRCKLFQKGAQKIVGFDFSASVTLDMTEHILETSRRRNNNDDFMNNNDAPMLVYDRKVGFKCADSFFFSGFDGEWFMKERYNAKGKIETVVSYTVDVRPKGPVPVAALEWRIREDVPTNLRAVKKAAMQVGEAGVLQQRERKETVRVRNLSRTSRISAANSNPKLRSNPVPNPFLFNVGAWERDETMAAYL